jgi:hypothetical protein
VLPSILQYAISVEPSFCLSAVRKAFDESKASNHQTFFANFARPDGFEPPTTWFEVIPDTLRRNPTKTAGAGFSKT